MKILKIFFVLHLFMVFLISYAFAQGVAINTTGTDPDASAILDIKSNTQGFLPPRLSITQRDAISNPAEFLIIFNTNTKCLESYIDDDWRTLWCYFTNSIIGEQSPCVNTNVSYSATYVVGLTYTWTVPTGWVILSGQNTNLITVTVGAASGNVTATPSVGSPVSLAVTPTPSSVGGSISGGSTPICVGSSTGIMTLSGHTGSVVRWQKKLNAGTWSNIANTATTYSEVPSSAGTWYYRAEVKNGSCPSVYSSERAIVVEPATAAGTVAIYPTNVCLSAGTLINITLTGYSGTIQWYRTTPNNGSWQNLNLSTPTINVILDTAGTWSFRAKTTGICGSEYSSSAYVQVIDNPPTACPASVTFNYNGSTVTYGVVSGTYNCGEYCWLDRNLGATQVANASNDNASFGDYFQWGRLDDGHQIFNSATTSTLSLTDNPGHSNFITNNTSPYSWQDPTYNTNLWQGVSGINNPCPPGWRLPTSSEWENEVTSWWLVFSNYGGFYSSLKLPTASQYRSQYGWMSNYINMGFYWASNVPGNTGPRYFRNCDQSPGCASIPAGYSETASGMHVRCIMD